MNSYRQTANRKQLVSVLKYINQNLQNNISIKTLSSEACMSEPNFYRCFKKQFGITPVEYINQQRMRAAKMMLYAFDVPLTEISFSCGFNNMSYFFRTFKRHTGRTPSQYRKSLVA